MSHCDEHGESHNHAHSHSHAAPTDFGPRFVIGIALNILIVALELVYGIISGSVALIADAGHNLSDVLGLAVAFGAVVLSARAPSARFTYGLKGTSILAALFNAVFLMLVIGALSYEAIHRFFEPEPIAAGTMMIVAAIGMIINGWNATNLPPFSLGYVNLVGLALIVPATIVAAPWGVALAHRLSRRTLRLAFGIFLCLTALRMTWALFG